MLIFLKIIPKILLFDFQTLIYNNKQRYKNMEKKKTKINRTVSIDRNLDNIMNEIITNKSKYIEWLIYQDLKNTRVNDERIKKIIL
jgi:hypothetical protein